jgi:plasmid stabilization system protein ParE
MRLELTQDAEQDLANAFDWYETQRPGLGFDFSTRWQR